MLKGNYSPEVLEAGVDEAGRGCLAGPVVAAAVILPDDFRHPGLNDSKKLNESTRYELRSVIENNAITYGIGIVDNETIDEVNILNATFLAMHKALEALDPQPAHLLIDGNRFKSFRDIPHHCIVKGDGIYLSIAAASILAKTYRDNLMKSLHAEYPRYGWNLNKGYPTLKHRKAISEFGISPYHRLSFKLNEQLTIF